MQIRFATELTSEEYVKQKAWRFATLGRCPIHPRGGCGFSRHGWRIVSISAEARDVARQNQVAWEYRGVAIVGGTLAVRAVVLMVLRALALLGRRKSEMVHVKMEAEARAWIAQKAAGNR